MVVLCYRNGALGRTVSALFSSCTKEGKSSFPSFIKDQNLHHYEDHKNFYRIEHPIIDLDYERHQGNTVVSSSSRSYFGRLLILFMSFGKWFKQYPELDRPLEFNQGNGPYGNQIEVLAITIADEINSIDRWYLDADYVLDILDFWQSPDQVINFLNKCGFQAENKLVKEFCSQVAETNQNYFDAVDKCHKIVDDVINSKVYPISLTFFEVAVCYALLMLKFNLNASSRKVLLEPPVSTLDFKKIIKD